MSGGRQTGTVPKTKHNTRVRRENPANHMPNNLDWHETYAPHRVRKESNTNPRLSDAGDDSFIYPDGPWIGLAPSNRTDDDELRWSNVKTSNITPERGNSSSNVDGFLPTRVIQRQEHSGPEEGADLPTASKDTVGRGRLKLKMEHSQRKIEELQQTQAALLSLRNKALCQVKPVQMEEMQQHSSYLTMRSKAIQQVKPVQVEMDRMANMEARLQTMQDYASQIMQAFVRDDANLVEQADLDGDLQLRAKLNELLAKKAQCDNILACIESENLPVGAASISSDDGETTSQFSRTRQGFSEVEDPGSRRDLNKQDNRELEHHSVPAGSLSYQNKELKLEEVKSKLEQLQTLLNRVESLPEPKATPRMNGEASSHVPHQPTCKNCPPNSILEKLHTKKIDLDQDMKKLKSFQAAQAAGDFHYNPPPPVESWTSSLNGATANSVDYSSEEGEVEYDESPVKLCSTGYLQPNTFPKPSSNGHPAGPKVPTGSVRESRRTSSRETRSRPMVPEADMRELIPNTSTLAEQISELQLQMEQMRMLYQGMLEKQQVTNFSSPQPWMPQPNLGYMQFMSPPTPHWHQHQLLINSLNQCCQLIWHQQRELAGLRQALAMIQDESRVFKCGGYGNNLNFDPSGLLWAQTSPQTLNNQVPPGNRANNYWDNFRSYSRQNLLSARNKSNEGSIAESLPVPRASTQTDNLRRRKENHTLGNSQVNRSRLPTGEPSEGMMNGCRSRRGRYNSNLKADATAVFSLEQSIYSELETVIAQAERSPQILLQLLTQLKNIRSQRPSPYEDGNPGFENECELLEHGLPSYPNLSPRIEEPRNHMDHGRKYEGVLEDIVRLIERQESESCSAELITEVVGYLCRTLALDGNTETSLHTALAKFKGARLRLATDNFLLTIVRVLNNQGNGHGSTVPAVIHDVEECDPEELDEEGAVGGYPIALVSPIPKPQPVEAELAEADQTPCNSTDNVEVFGGEGGLPDLELDNQELPPREENQEQPLQEP